MVMVMPAAGIRAPSARPSVADTVRAIWHPSPNHGPRRGGAIPDIIVLHYTAMGRADAALKRLCDPDVEVSAHYLIGTCGTVWQMVEEHSRAWHAGAGQWGDICDVNSRSVGIELDNTGHHPFPDPQMRALEALMGGIMTRWRIPPQRVIAHSDMAPARKCDPGPRFDWARLARLGLSVWPKVSAVRGDFVQNARRFGYPMNPDDGAQAADLALQAFRQRFRPWANGPLDDTDRALMADLAARYPVDQDHMDA